MTKRTIRDPTSENEIAWVISNRNRDRHCEAAAARLERLLTIAPNELLAHLQGDLDSLDDRRCEGALFELYLWWVFSSLKPEPRIVIQPNLPSGSSPDFELSWANGDSVFIEATTYDIDADAKDASYRVNLFFRKVAPFIKVPGFVLHLSSFKPGHQSPSPKRVAGLLNEWLATLSHADVVSRFKEPPGDCSPLAKTTRILDERSGWSFALSPFPLSDPNQLPERILGADGSRDLWTRYSGVELREVVQRKRRQHKGCDRLVVAACCKDWPGDPHANEVADALYGTRKGVLDERGEIQLNRSADGVWSRGEGAGAGLLGVISTSFCRAWTFPHDHLSLWMQPGIGGESLSQHWPFHRVTLPSRLGRNNELIESRGVPPTRWLGDVGSHEPGSQFRFLDGQTRAVDQ